MKLEALSESTAKAARCRTIGTAAPGPQVAHRTTAAPGKLRTATPRRSARLFFLALVVSSASGAVGWGVGPLFHLDTTIAGVPDAALDFQTIRVTPNPSGSAMTVDLCSRNGGLHTMTIHAPDGRVIRTFPQVILARGQRQAWVWDSRDQAGRAVSPGVYFCSIQTPTGRLSARALVLR